MRTKKSPGGKRRRPLLEELERRLLLSADFPSLLIDPDFADPGLAPPPAQIALLDAQADATPTETEALSRREIVIVDAGVDDYELLIEDLRAATPPAGSSTSSCSTPTGTASPRSVFN